MSIISGIRNYVLANPGLRDAAIQGIKAASKLAYSSGLMVNVSRKAAIANIDGYNYNRILGPKKQVCYAPFSNIYFGRDGVMSACCFNRDYNLGTYPHSTIKQAWTGKQAQELRRQIANYNLNVGCQGCLAAIESQNYASVHAGTYDYFTGTHQGYPKRMDFELSNTCNLECTMCSGFFSSSIRKNREGLEPLPEVYGDDFLAQLEEFIPHLQYVKFLGGEPFLIDIYYKIMERIVAVNPACIMFVQTNGTVLNNRVKNILAKGRFNIGISIDSLEKETYEAIRVNAKYETVFKNIEWFAQYCCTNKRNFNIAFSPMQNTLAEVPAFIHFANRIGAHAYFNIVENPAHLSIQTMAPQVIKQHIVTLSALQKEQGDYLKNKNAIVLQSFINQLQAWADTPEAKPITV